MLHPALRAESSLLCEGNAVLLTLIYPLARNTTTFASEMLAKEMAHRLALVQTVLHSRVAPTTMEASVVSPWTNHANDA